MFYAARRSKPPHHTNTHSNKKKPLYLPTFPSATQYKNKLKNKLVLLRVVRRQPADCHELRKTGKDGNGDRQERTPRIQRQHIR